MKLLSKSLFFISALLISACFALPVSAFVSGSYSLDSVIDFDCSDDSHSVYFYIDSEPTTVAFDAAECNASPLWSDYFGEGTFYLLENDSGVYCSGYGGCFDISFNNSSVTLSAAPTPTIGGYFITLPSPDVMTSDLSLATAGMFDDLLPIALIVSGLILGIFVIDWLITRFFHLETVGVHYNPPDKGDWAMHINTLGEDATGRKHTENDDDDIGLDEDLDA